MPHYANDSKGQQFSSKDFSHFETSFVTVYNNRSIPVQLPSFHPLPKWELSNYFWTGFGLTNGSNLTFLLRWTDVQGFIF